jgi:hypothetical protein
MKSREIIRRFCFVKARVTTFGSEKSMNWKANALEGNLEATAVLRQFHELGLTL